MTIASTSLTDVTDAPEIADVDHLTDRALLDAAERLAREERAATAALVRTPMEIDSPSRLFPTGQGNLWPFVPPLTNLGGEAADHRPHAERVEEERVDIRVANGILTSHGLQVADVERGEEDVGRSCPPRRRPA